MKKLNYIFIALLVFFVMSIENVIAYNCPTGYREVASYCGITTIHCIRDACTETFILERGKGTDGNLYNYCTRDATQQEEIKEQCTRGFFRASRIEGNRPYCWYDPETSCKKENGEEYSECNNTVTNTAISAVCYVDPIDNSGQQPSPSASCPNGVSITLDPNGGSVSGDTSLSCSTANCTIPLPTPTYSDHTFVGWWSNNDKKYLHSYADCANNGETLRADWSQDSTASGDGCTPGGSQTPSANPGTSDNLLACTYCCPSGGGCFSEDPCTDGEVTTVHTDSAECPVITPNNGNGGSTDLACYKCDNNYVWSNGNTVLNCTYIPNIATENECNQAGSGGSGSEPTTACYKCGSEYVWEDRNGDSNCSLVPTISTKATCEKNNTDQYTPNPTNPANPTNPSNNQSRCDKVYKVESYKKYYTITYNLRSLGGSFIDGSTKRVQILTGNEIIGEFKTNPIKNGYVFKYWTTDSSGNGSKFNLNTKPTSDITLYPHFEKYTNDKWYCKKGVLDPARGLCYIVNKNTRSDYKEGYTGAYTFTETIYNNNSLICAYYYPECSTAQEGAIYLKSGLPTGYKVERGKQNSTTGVYAGWLSDAWRSQNTCKFLSSCSDSKQNSSGFSSAFTYNDGCIIRWDTILYQVADSVARSEEQSDDGTDLEEDDDTELLYQATIILKDYCTKEQLVNYTTAKMVPGTRRATTLIKKYTLKSGCSFVSKIGDPVKVSSIDGAPIFTIVDSDITQTFYVKCSEECSGGKVSQEEKEAEGSPATGDALIYLAWILGVGAAGYSIYYFKNNKESESTTE